MRRHRQLTALVVLLALLAGALWFAPWAKAGPLSDSEVIRAIGGVPGEGLVVRCSTTATRNLTALPTTAMLRLSPDGGGVYYGIGGATISPTINTGAYLGQAAFEYVQNGAGAYVGCVTASGTATLSVSVMR